MELHLILGGLAVGISLYFYFRYVSSAQKRVPSEGARGEAIQEALQVFREHFQASPRVVSCAPARVNLMGGATDYNQGFVLPMALEMDTVMVAAPAAGKQCTVVSKHVKAGVRRVQFELSVDMQPVEKGDSDWANYVTGVVAQYLKLCEGRPSACVAFDAVVLSGIPLGGGLSSSASLETAVACTLEGLWGVEVDGKTRALMCQKAEHTFPKAMCGIMDQYISSLARTGHVLFLDCRSLESSPVPLDDPALSLAVIDSKVNHKISGLGGVSSYGNRRQECAEAVQALRASHPAVEALRDVDGPMLEAASLPPVALRRARHVVNEIRRVRETAAALRRRDYVLVGRLMYEGHESHRADFENSTEELDYLVQLSREVPGVYGARMTGGGFGGSVVALVQTEQVEALRSHVLRKYEERFRLSPSIHVSRAGAGAAQWLL